MEYDESRTHAVRSEPLNDTGHSFLSAYTNEEIAHGIASMDPARRDQMIRRHFPGTHFHDSFTPVEIALAAAGADFTVEKFPLMAVMPPVEEGGEPRAVEVTGKVGLTRTDTSRVLGVAGENYGIVQNMEAFAAAKVLADERSFDIQAVEVIDGGSRIRVSGLIGESQIAQMGQGPDVLAHYGIFEAAHDGIHAVVGSLETLRLTCFNGMTARTKDNSFRVSHTSRAADRNRAAQKLLLDLQGAAIAEAEVFADIAQRRMSLPDFRIFAKDLMDKIRGEVDEDASNRKKNGREREMAELERLFLHGDGNTGVSAYCAYNAVTDYVTPRKAAAKSAIAYAKKYQGALEGHGSKIKARALRMLTR